MLTTLKSVERANKCGKSYSCKYICDNDKNKRKGEQQHGKLASQSMFLREKRKRKKVNFCQKAICLKKSKEPMEKETIKCKKKKTYDPW